MKTNILRFVAAVLVAGSLFACQKQIASDAEQTTASTNSSLTTSSTLVFAPSCGMLRTQTQGGWGAKPAGNNPGTYLHAHFNATFSGGLTLGCYPNNYYIRLTSAQAVTDLLPVGGTPSALKANATDPVTLKNVLVGQLVALKLSVSFDAADANFGQSSVALGNMIIGSGTFKGLTVAQFLAQAEAVLGGCSKAYTPQQLNETATLINQSFDDGTTNSGFLLCPGDGDGGGSDIPA
ncbi:hypothetical protein A3860_09315 [Niastella vici]|uniref:CHRD domain-containing protein n=1 Tax=Niastella vici TaxID=1703345 RepID=A0A1V9FHH5_9BACT|nr:hypothetical protein [Niastella vici]OQP57813.1 hypothetical protein A3860_09315 [Niastella vici]